MALHATVLAHCMNGAAMQGERIPKYPSGLYKMKVKVSQLCSTFCDPMDYTVHRILQARILEWVAFPFSRGIFPTQGSNRDLPHCRGILYQQSPQGSPSLNKSLHPNPCLRVCFGGTQAGGGSRPKWRAEPCPEWEGWQGVWGDWRTLVWEEKDLFGHFNDLSH